MLPACLGADPVRARLRGRRRCGRRRSVGALGMSAIIFSGAAQMLASQLLAAGAPVRRHPHLRCRSACASSCTARRWRLHCRTLPPRWQRAVSFLLTDQAFAASIRKFDSHGDPRGGSAALPRRRMALWSCVAGRQRGRLFRRQRDSGVVVARFHGAAVLHRAARAAAARRAADRRRRDRGRRRRRARRAADAAQPRSPPGSSESSSGPRPNS